jgi:putative effector of murein hydrolase
MLIGVATAVPLYAVLNLMSIALPSVLVAVLAGCFAAIAGIFARKFMPDS